MADEDFYARRFALRAEQEYAADLAARIQAGNLDLDEAARVASMSPSKFSDMQGHDVLTRRANGNHAASDTTSFLGGF